MPHVATGPEVRGKDPVCRCLIQALHVPMIYFDAPWPTEDDRVDLLVLDRAGVGDVHVVAIRHNASAALGSLPTLFQQPAHYRWIAYFAETLDDSARFRFKDFMALHPHNEPGRVGIIEIEGKPRDEYGVEDLSAEIKLTAERFKGSFYDEADAFKALHQADIEFR